MLNTCRCKCHVAHRRWCAGSERCDEASLLVAVPSASSHNVALALFLHHALVNANCAVFFTDKKTFRRRHNYTL